MKLNEKLAATAMALGLAAVSVPTVAQANEANLKVVGTWGFQLTYQDYEKPTFETILPEMSNGQIAGNIQPMTDVGLNGTEIMKLLTSGIYDAGFVVFTYIAQGDAIFEGMDMPMAFSTADEARALLDGFSAVSYPAMEETHGVKILGHYSFPFTTIVCRDAFTSLADIRGRKTRVYSAGLSDMIEGLGGTPVTIPFSEVIPALQRGVVDCATVGPLPLYNGKWYDVVKYFYELPLNAGTAFLGINKAKFDALSPETQQVLINAGKDFENRAWEGVKKLNELGAICVTGEGECPLGEPADMQRVPEAPGDREIRERVLREYILPRWAERCGDDCAELWYELAGSKVGIEK